VGRVRGAVPLTVALVLALLAIGLLGFSSTLNPVDALLGRGPIVTVPDVVEAPRPRAEADLSDVGLDPKVTEAFSLTAPRGTVVSQRPEAGDRVRQGTTVRIVVSKGANRVEMPDAVGQQFDEVAEPFEAADIPLDVERVPSERVAEGIVMEQSPGPGIQVTGVDTVSFTVSAGPADRPVPEVVGRTLEGAAFELGRSGLTLGEVTIRDDPEVPPGAVVSADPAPGAEVPIETAVDLVVSGGPTAVPVPDVVNDTEQSARSTLEQAGFVVALATQLVADGGSGSGAVFDQYPDPGTDYRPGQTVTIVVGRELPPSPPPRVTTTTTTSTTTTTTPRRR
jgi:beta-lactam-binding protein with PASTA domain